MTEVLSRDQIFQSCIDYYDARSAEYARDFSDEVEKKPYDKNFLHLLATQLPPGAAILDVGCSSAAQQAACLHNLGFRIDALDLSPQNICIARKNYPGIRFHCMNMLNLQFPDESFDALNAFYSIIHIPDSALDELFAGFYRVLKRGGKLALAVHAHGCEELVDAKEHPVFFRGFDETRLLEQLKNAGFLLRSRDCRPPLYDFEFQSRRIYALLEKP